jgi:hypothetical protein
VECATRTAELYGYKAEKTLDKCDKLLSEGMEIGHLESRYKKYIELEKETKVRITCPYFFPGRKVYYNQHKYTKE